MDNGERIGSPPQVRGKLHILQHHMEFIRITPAGAGKTAKLMLNSLYGKGSPPQVRGKRVSAYVFAAANGITPAGAGKTGYSA